MSEDITRDNTGAVEGGNSAPRKPDTDGLDNSQSAAPVGGKGSLGARLDNFWYHYKWHSIVAIFLIVTVLVCSLQMCRKESYDVYVLYAGDRDIGRLSEGGSIPEYNRVVSALERVAADSNGDGEITVGFSDLFALSDEQIAEIEADPEHELGYALIQQDAEALKQRLLYSEYYLCFLSIEVYEQYKTVDGIPLFVPLAGYLGDNTDAVLYSDTAIRLDSLEFGNIPVMQGFEDTVVCLRAKSAMAEHFNQKLNEQSYENCEAMLRAILGY